MAILRLMTVPDPILREKAKKVRRVDASVQKLADDMIETMQHEGGLGLAANQVGVLKRVCTIQIPEQDVEARVLINPEVVEAKGERQVEERCLSVPGYKATIFRSEYVKVKAQDGSGKPFKLKADGLLAQALEHEIDHLNGILYIDHLRAHEDLQRIGENSEGPHRHSEAESEKTAAEAGVE